MNAANFQYISPEYEFSSVFKLPFINFCIYIHWNNHCLQKISSIKSEDICNGFVANGQTISMMKTIRKFIGKTCIHCLAFCLQKVRQYYLLKERTTLGFYLYFQGLGFVLFVPSGTVHSPGV